jgi:hypothetical protein
MYDVVDLTKHSTPSNCNNSTKNSKAYLLYKGVCQVYDIVDLTHSFIQRISLEFRSVLNLRHCRLDQAPNLFKL